MFCRRLKELRLTSNLTQQELAQRLNLSAGAVGMYEQGRRTPDFETLGKIAEYFGVSVDYLLGRTDIKDSNEYNFINDINDLGRRIKNAQPETGKIIYDILDTLYAILDKNIDNKNNVHILDTMRLIAQRLYVINMHLYFDNEVKNTGNSKSAIKDTFITYAKHKNEINHLLDRLYRIYLINIEKSESDRSKIL